MTLFHLKLYLLTVPVFFVIDLAWLGVVARDFYRDNLAHLLSATVNWPAAIVFYLIFIAGILYFAVVPALAEGSVWRAVINGALFGFFTYMTYDLTNLATLPNPQLANQGRGRRHPLGDGAVRQRRHERLLHRPLARVSERA